MSTQSEAYSAREDVLDRIAVGLANDENGDWMVHLVVPAALHNTPIVVTQVSEVYALLQTEEEAA